METSEGWMDRRLWRNLLGVVDENIPLDVNDTVGGIASNEDVGISSQSGSLGSGQSWAIRGQIVLQRVLTAWARRPP